MPRIPLILLLAGLAVQLTAMSEEERRVLMGDASFADRAGITASSQALAAFRSDLSAGRHDAALAWVESLRPEWSPAGPNADLHLLIAAPVFSGPAHRTVQRAVLGRLLAIAPPAWDPRQEWIGIQAQAVRMFVSDWEIDFGTLPREEARDHARADIRLLMPWLRPILARPMTCDEVTARSTSGDWSDPPFPSALDPRSPDRNDPRYLAWRDAVIRVNAQRGPAWMRAEAFERINPKLMPVLRVGWPRLDGGRLMLRDELAKAAYPAATIAMILNDVYGESAR